MKFINSLRSGKIVGVINKSYTDRGLPAPFKKTPSGKPKQKGFAGAAAAMSNAVKSGRAKPIPKATNVISPAMKSSVSGPGKKRPPVAANEKKSLRSLPKKTISASASKSTSYSPTVYSGGDKKMTGKKKSKGKAKTTYNAYEA